MFACKLTHACVLWVAVLQATAVAQTERYSGPPGGHFPPVPPYPPDMFFTYDHASTAMEGALRGMAALRYADGSYLVNASQAAILREQARWLALDNKRRWVEYRIGLRIWREFERQARVTKKRIKNETNRAAKLAVYRLDSNELDRITGRISWPQLLQAAAYDDLRRKVDVLCRHKGAGYDLPAAVAKCEISECVERLRRALRADRSQLDKSEYLAAQNFLCGLKYEHQ